jgi:hypothetical protein
MPTLREVDFIASRLNRARNQQVEHIALRVGCPEGKVRSWRRGTLDLADWVVVEICRELNLDDQVLDVHRQRRRQRHAQDVKAQRHQEKAA